MIVNTRFEVESPIDVVWRHMLDVQKIAPCVPGARLTEIIDDRTYAGVIEVKLGPISMSYKGRVQVEQIDEQAHRAQMKAEGSDVRGRGGAFATVNAEMHTEGTKTAVTMESDVAVTGLAAQFGRTAIMQSVAQWLADRFANCLEKQLKASS